LRGARASIPFLGFTNRQAIIGSRYYLDAAAHPARIRFLPISAQF